MYTITIKEIYKITADKTVYVSKFNFEFYPRAGMELKINDLNFKITGVAEKSWPDDSKLIENKMKHQFDLILKGEGDFSFELNKPYKLDIPSAPVSSKLSNKR